MIDKYLELSHELDKKQCLERIKFEIKYLIKNEEVRISTKVLTKDARVTWVFSNEEFEEIINEAIKELNESENLNLYLQDEYIILG